MAIKGGRGKLCKQLALETSGRMRYKPWIMRLQMEEFDSYKAKLSLLSVSQEENTQLTIMSELCNYHNYIYYLLKKSGAKWSQSLFSHLMILPCFFHPSLPSSALMAFGSHAS